MAWCPKCRNEYKDGITECVDCGLELVEVLPDEDLGEFEATILGITDDEEIAKRIVTYLMYNGLQSPCVMKNENEEETEYAVAIADFERIDAEMMLQKAYNFTNYEETSLADFIPGINEKLGEIESEEAEQMLSELRTEQSTVYVKKRDKYNDLKFSGLSFIIFGLIGVGIAILNYYRNFINLETYSLVIMGIVFVFFFIVGIASLVKAKKIKSLVSEETEVSDEVITWIEENITDELISTYYDENDTEENNYFTVHGKLCEITAENFPHFPYEYIEELMDERYNQFCER